MLAKCTLGKLISNYINEGMLAPHEIVMDLVEEQVKDKNMALNSYLMDFLGQYLKLLH